MKNLQTKKSIIWTLLLVVAVLIYGYTQLGWFNTPAYLLSITAGDGAVIGEQDSDGCLDLTLKSADHVIWFSDRPEHTAFSTDVPSLLNIWEDEFGNNPPNADLQLFRDGSDAVIILTLGSTPVWDKDTQALRFDKACPIALVGKNSKEEIDLANIVGKTFSKAVLFIDHFVWTGNDDFETNLDDGPFVTGPVEVGGGCKRVEVVDDNPPISGQGFDRVYPIEYGVDCSDYPITRTYVDYGF